MTQLFVNLPTSDLERAKAFYTSLGATINPRFTNEDGACIVWDENIFFMVITREHFGTFTDKEVADPAVTAQVLIALGRDSREHVDETLAAGLAHGGSEPRGPQDHGFMYSRVLDDPDGNGLEFMYIDPAAAQDAEAQE